ncbi:short-chain dehydrogenase [Desulfocarbo indianensis]|nr:short-chain dehydrogenase [Desulfocarbo indianensis]
MQALQGKAALITGGSDGIGLAIAEAFARQGADLVIIGRDRDKLERRKEELLQHGKRVCAAAADLSQNGFIPSVRQAAREAGLKISVLVNNAGIARFTPFADMDEAGLDYHLNLNLKAPYWLTRAFLDDLIALQGNVINISSYFAERMLPDRPSTAYSLSKGALNSFTRALAFELGAQKIRVNAIAPGTVDTPQVAANLGRLSRPAQARFQAMVRSIYPLQRLGSPQEVANLAVFLASDQAAWITGGIFPVDGGLTTN